MASDERLREQTSALEAEQERLRYFGGALDDVGPDVRDRSDRRGPGADFLWDLERSCWNLKNQEEEPDV